MKRKIFVVAILICCGLLSLALREPEKISRDGFAMNTLIRMSVYANNETPLDEAYSLLNRLDKELSMYDSSSDISKINSAAGVEKVRVPDEVVDVVKESLRLYKITDGVFNPLIGPVTRLWKINQADGVAPTQASLDSAIKLSDINNLEINDKEIFLKSPGCVLDLGGIAKGFASDRIAALLKSHGVKSGLIDLGGNVYVVGKKLEDDSDWNIGVRDPSAPYNSPALVLSVHNTSVITSGGYERFKIIDGKKYSHFFDVKTGESITNDLLSVTIVTPDGSLGDGLATAFMITGVNKALEILGNMAEQPGVIFITQEGIIATENLRPVITKSLIPVTFASGWKAP
mgnify:CR=1 FL=1